MILFSCWNLAFAQPRSVEYKAAACDSLVQTHIRLAILPFWVSLDSTLYAKIDNRIFYESRTAAASLHLQLFVYKYLLSYQANCPIPLQDVYATNARLAKLHCDMNRLLNIDKQTLADSLGVDDVLFGIITADDKLFKTDSTLAPAVRSFNLLDGKMERKDFFLTLYDRKLGLLWSMAKQRNELTSGANLNLLQTFIPYDLQSLPYWTGAKINAF
jgi:hypothetical protein